MPLDKRTLSFRRGVVATIALVLALIAAGCAGESSPDAATSSPQGAQTENATATTEPLFLPTADGGQLDWNSLAGQDVMLWFWAPW